MTILEMNVLDKFELDLIDIIDGKQSGLLMNGFNIQKFKCQRRFNNDPSKPMWKLLTRQPIDFYSKDIVKILAKDTNFLIEDFFQDDSISMAFYCLSDYEEFSIRHFFLVTEEQQNKPRDQIQAQAYEIGEWLSQIMDAVQYLHNNDIFHSYLNSEDIYIRHRTIIKIGGFYFAEKLESKEAESVRRERLLLNCVENEKLHLGLKYDIWCIGLVLYEMLFRKSAAEENFENSGQPLPALPEEYRKKFKDIYRLYLERDLKKRKWLNDIKKEDFFHTIFHQRRDMEQKREKRLGWQGQYEILSCLNMDKHKTYKAFEHIKKDTEDEIKVMRVIQMRSLDSPFDVQREVDILNGRLKECPYVIKYFDDFAYQNFRCVVLEYSNFGSLKDYLIFNGKIESDLLHPWILQLTEGLSFIHKQNVIHRFIKPSNIIVAEESKHLKYTDFFYAKKDPDSRFKLTRILNLSEYSAPELARDAINYSYPVDIWSLGCVIFEMVSNKKAFESVSKISTNEPPRLEESDKYATLVTRMIQREAENRINAEQCYDEVKQLNPDTMVL